MTRSAVRDEAGTALLEALVALAVVGVIVVGSHAVLRTALRAQVRAEAALTALAAATAEAERLRGGDPAGSAVGDVAATAWTPVRCRSESPIGHATVTDPAGLVPLRVVVPRAPSTPLVGLVVTGDGGPDGVPVTVRVPPSDPMTVVADAAGCLAVPAGHLLVEDVVGADAPSTSRPLPSPAAAVGTTVVLRRSGLLEVEVVSSGRLPDVVLGGAVTWWVPGDPEGRTAEPGRALRVGVGPDRVVVGACDDARAAGTTAPVIVVADGTVGVSVVLGSVRVVGAPPLADRLHLRRAGPCPGPADRPELIWDLADGSTVGAVPDGTWDARLVDAAGRTVAGPIPVAVAGPGAVALAWP